MINLEFFMERPKICAPIMGRHESEIREELAAAKQEKPDMIEWRADFFSDLDSTIDMLKKIRDEIPELPIIFTLRKYDEGGAIKLEGERRRDIISAAILSGLIDFVDLEGANESGFLSPLLEAAEKMGVAVIVSAHDFHKTPSKEEIIRRLNAQALCGDIAKIAVTPQSPADVLTLLSAVFDYSRQDNSKPTIAISMGQLGLLSRLGGGVFGSVLTFASLREASAPGQLPVAKLRTALELLYP